VQLAPEWQRCGLLVANTHIIFTPDKGEVKLGQVREELYCSAGAAFVHCLRSSTAAMDYCPVSCMHGGPAALSAGRALICVAYFRVCKQRTV
jgi:hypothetical protein